MFDLVLKNCRIFGADESEDTIGIRHGRIAYVGHNEPHAAKKSIDLEGKIALPGFIDSHTHLQNLGLSLVRLDLSSTATRAEALEKVAEFAEASKSGSIVGYGWDETQWGEKDYLTRQELDFLKTPAVLYRKDMHMAVLNSKALSITGIESKDGAVKEEKMALLSSLTDPDENELRKGLQAAADYAVSQGITTVRDIMGARARNILERDKLPLRVFKLIYDREYAGKSLSDYYSWGVKMFLDGSIGSRTAAHSGWSQENLKFSNEELNARLVGLWKQGIPAAMHAIGETALEQAVMSLKSQKGSLRNSVEHFELVFPELLHEIGDSTVVSSQPNFLQWSNEGGLYENTLGTEWIGKDNTFRTILDSGVHLAFGSDCMPMGPSYGIGLAVNSKHSRQRITVDEAIWAYTSGSAYLLHEELVSGKIADGFRGDLAIFDEKYTDEPSHIGHKKPLMTIVGGNVVFQAH